MRTATFLSVLAIAAVSATSVLAAPMVKTMETSKGQVLAGAKDMTLHPFDKYSKGLSNCYVTCATNWPPFMAATCVKASVTFKLASCNDVI